MIFSSDISSTCEMLLVQIFNQKDLGINYEFLRTLIWTRRTEEIKD